MQLTRLLAAASAAVVLAGAALTAEAAQKRTASKTAAVRSKSSKAGKSGRSRSRRAAGPARQAAPTPERYREIQQVLTEKGYYTGPVNGDWGAESVAALKRFQADQKLASDGKLGALTLIALGLGPKRNEVADIAARPATEPPAEP